MTKKKMSVTARAFTEQKPISVRQKTAHPNPLEIGVRLSSTISPKIDTTLDELLETLKFDTSTICVPDTGLFSAPIENELWQSLLNQHLLITPGIWKELEPWRNNPFYNESVCKLVIEAEGKQSIDDQTANEVVFYPDRKSRGTPCYRRIEIMKEVTAPYYDHAYKYYFNLLAIRKWIGKATEMVLQKKLGRKPTDEEIDQELQKKYKERGLFLAQKGRRDAENPNISNDEQTIVMAIQTAIMRGTNVVILTRDNDIQEQFVKFYVHLKEHYRSMLAADYYAQNSMNPIFEEIQLSSVPEWASVLDGESVVRWKTTEIEFEKHLPAPFRPIILACYWIAGSSKDLKASYALANAEIEMGRLLRIKSTTNGLSTDRLDGRNCYIETKPLDKDNHEVLVYIGKDRRLELAGQRFNAMDYYNTLHCNEKTTHYS